MRRWIGLALAGGVLCLAPWVLRTTGTTPDADADDPLAKAKAAEQGYSKAVTPPPLTSVDLTHLKVEDSGVTAPAHGNRTATLTIQPTLQRLAEKILKTNGIPEAAVVMTEVSTGRVLVYASHVEKGPQRDLCVEATAPAASVFKIITASTLFEVAGLTPDTRQCYWGGEQKLEMANLIDDPKKDRWCATVSEAMGRSLNTVFARLALKNLQPPKIVSMAHNYGFGEPFAFDVPVAQGTINMPEDQLGFARTSAGFWNTTMSPVMAAELVATVANRGNVVKPYVVEKVTDENKTLLYRAANRTVLRRAIKAETADAVTKTLEAAVTDGTCYKAFHDTAGRPFLPNISVAGKTGTLTRNETEQFYTWFAGFAPSRAPEVAISVLVVNTATWRVKANTVAREMLRAYFAQKDTPGVSMPKY